MANCVGVFWHAALSLISISACVFLTIPLNLVYSAKQYLLC